MAPSLQRRGGQVMAQPATPYGAPSSQPRCIPRPETRTGCLTNAVTPVPPTASWDFRVGLSIRISIGLDGEQTLVMRVGMDPSENGRPQDEPLKRVKFLRWKTSICTESTVLRRPAANLRQHMRSGIQLVSHPGDL